MKNMSARSEEDRISQLPDPLICQILSHLPIKDSVSRSLLSKRWRSLWLWVPSLDLASLEFPGFPNLKAFLSFGNRFFDSNSVSCLEKVKLTIMDIRSNREEDDDDVSYLKSWIDVAVKRKIKHLHVCCYPYWFISEISTSFYICETLVSLKLSQVILPDPEFVSLPCLKILHLAAIRYLTQVTFERLVSSCPVLEELEILEFVSCHLKLLRVLSWSLKNFSINCDFDPGVVIDAPQLCFLRTGGRLPETFLITNIDANVKLDISLSSTLVSEEAHVLSRRYLLRSFLSKISNVRDMIIRLGTFKLFCAYLKQEPLPQFLYLSNLQVAIDYSHFKWLPTLLESFPNLKYLILECYDDFERRPLEMMKQNTFSFVPQCLLSSLEFVDFKVQISSLIAETNLVRYFLVNSAILKKLTLPLYRHASQHIFVKKLLKIPRRSTECELVFL